MSRNYKQKQKIKKNHKNMIAHLKYLNGDQPLKPQILTRKRNMLFVKKSRP